MNTYDILRKYRKNVIFLGILILNTILIFKQWSISNGTPYLIDNNETYGMLREVKTRFKFSESNSTFLFNESTSNNKNDHPIIYTHQGISARIVFYIFYLFNINNTELIILISSIILGTITLVAFYNIISLIFDRRIATIITSLLVSNYLLFSQMQFQISQIYRVCIWTIVLYFIIRMQKNIYTHWYYLIIPYGLSFLIAIGELSFSLYFVMFMFLMLLMFNNLRNFRFINILIFWGTGTAYFIYQLIKYYGFDGLTKDILNTYLQRATGQKLNYQEIQEFAVQNDIVNLFAEYNPGPFSFNNFFKSLNSEYVLNLEFTNILAIFGSIIVFALAIIKYLNFRTKENLFLVSVSIAILMFGSMLYYTSSLDSSSGSIIAIKTMFYSDLNYYILFFSVLLANLIKNKNKFLRTLRILLLSISGFILWKILTQKDYSLYAFTEIVLVILVLVLLNYVINWIKDYYLNIVRDKIISDLIVNFTYYSIALIIPAVVLNIALPGYLNNEIYSYQRPFLFINYYFCLAILFKIIFFRRTNKLSNLKLFDLIIIVFVVALTISVSIAYKSYDDRLNANRFQGIISFLQENELSDSGFVSDNYPGFISLFANTWGHWDSFYLQKRYDVGCKLAFDRRANNNRTIRVDETIFPKYYISAPPINNLQVPSYLQNGDSIKIAWLAQLKNNMLPGDRIIFEESDSLTGSLIIELSPCQ